MLKKRRLACCTSEGDRKFHFILAIKIDFDFIKKSIGVREGWGSGHSEATSVNMHKKSNLPGGVA